MACFHYIYITCNIACTVAYILSLTLIHLASYKEGRSNLLELAVWRERIRSRALAPTLSSIIFEACIAAFNTVRLGAKCKMHSGNEP